MKSTLDCVRKSIQSLRLKFTQESLHFRPELFNGIQIRTIRRKINVSNTRAVQQIFHYLCMVRLHIIHYEDRIAVQMRKQISSRYRLNLSTVVPPEKLVYRSVPSNWMDDRMVVFLGLESGAESTALLPPNE